MLTGGQVTDCTAGAALLDHLPECEILRADKGDSLCRPAHVPDTAPLDLFCTN